jgi:hypothetical protein
MCRQKDEAVEITNGIIQEGAVLRHCSFFRSNVSAAN